MATQEEILGTDIKLIDGDIQFDFNQDFKLISGKDNLGQALNNRLNTGILELSFYTNYGSELPTLIGEQNNILTRNEASGYIYESIINDPRVLDVRDIEVSFEDDKITSSVTIVSTDENNDKNLVFNIE